jgi:hypothetical protein
VTAYLDRTGFKSLSVMPAVDLDALETEAAGWIDAQLTSVSRWIDSRLAKRYATPFTAPYPDVVTGWLAKIVTKRCYLRRGVDPTDPQFVEIKADADTALAEIKEAADAVDGLFELPLRADTTASGVSKGTPSVYSERSPYSWTSIQGDAGRNDDSNGGGSYG